MIIMKFIPVLVLSDELTLQIKEVHTIARVPGNLQVFSFNFPLTFQRKLGRSAYIILRAEKPLQRILLDLWMVSVTLHMQWSENFYVPNILPPPKKKKKGYHHL